jgi:cell division septum initiation protein DivIVA
MKKIASGVESIEAEAEMILDSARIRANEILLKANEEADKIISSGLALNEVHKECEQVVNQAKQEVDRKIEESRIKAAEMKTDIEKKAEKIIKDIVGKIIGSELK